MAPGDELFMFKQRYKPRNEAATKLLNQKHVRYIATRPGVMCNPGSGFGLWGRLPEMKAVANIGDLRSGIDAVGKASERHTVYRAILSVDEKTAKEYGLYEREAWEKLLRSHISVLRAEMRIKPENFCWMASMHYKKRHPHVHIVYWDNGKEPRREHIPPERFEAMAAHVRSAFTGALVNSEEIHKALGETDATIRETRLRLRALLKDANIPEAPDLDKIKTAEHTQLGDELLELAKTMPAKGALKYAYLPQPYKAKLDAYIEHILAIPAFAGQSARFASLTEEVSRLYGNTGALAGEYRSQAQRKLVTQLANETLRYLKDVAAAPEAEQPPEDVQALIEAARSDAVRILASDAAYRELLDVLPNYRTPLAVLREDKAVKAKLDEVSGRLARDVRIRAKAEALIGKETAARAEKAALRREVNAALRRAMGRVVWEQAQEAKGYGRQQRVELSIHAMLTLFRDMSRSNGQMQAQRDLRREKYRSLSETAKQNLRQSQSQAGGWEMEL